MSVQENYQNPNIELLRETLAEYLGIEPEDIDLDDNLMEDLHMRSSDLTDFFEILNSKGFDTSTLDITKIQTLSDLIEALDLDYD